MNKFFLVFNLIILLILILMIVYFNPFQNGLPNEKVQLENGECYYNIILPNFRAFQIGLTQNGDLKYVSNFIDEKKQVINFFENGIIKSKLYYNDENKIHGRAYYFYQNSGCLSGDYNYQDGITVGSAVTYHDTSDHIKEIMLYNDLGELYYRKTFDWYGNLIKEEGKK